MNLNTSTMSIESVTSTSSSASSSPDSPFSLEYGRKVISSDTGFGSSLVTSDLEVSMVSSNCLNLSSTSDQENHQPKEAGSSCQQVISSQAVISMTSMTPKQPTARRPLKRSSKFDYNQYYRDQTPTGGTTAMFLGTTPTSKNSNNEDSTMCSKTDKMPYCSKDIEPMEMSPSLSKKDLESDSNKADQRIMDAVDKCHADFDLIGDYSRSHSLPLIQGKHHDLKSISPDTMARLLKGEIKSPSNETGNGKTEAEDEPPTDYVIVDCRYPYEFEGGHIRGAVNIYTLDGLIGKFFNENSNLIPSMTLSLKRSGSCPDVSQIGEDEETNVSEESSLSQPPLSNKTPNTSNNRKVVIFHCEFSSKRGPRLYRALRKHDRGQNRNAYPTLRYPEIYILEGGYKAFYESNPDLCVPSGYRTMESDMDECRHYESLRSKSFALADETCGKTGKATRPPLRSRGVKRSTLGIRNFD